MNGNTIGEQDDFEATRDRILRDASKRETKAEKVARLQREVREFRVETLQDAARILEQLDEKLIGPYTNAKLVTVEFLKQMAEAIRKAP